MRGYSHPPANWKGSAIGVKFLLVLPAFRLDSVQLKL